MKEFKKEVSLGMEVVSYRVEKDTYVFTVSFNKELSISDFESPITSLEYKIYDVCDENCFTDNPYDPKTGDNNIYLWNNNELLNIIFEKEDMFYNAIQDVCIEYCKEHKLPYCLHDLEPFEDGEALFLTAVIMDTIDDAFGTGKKIISGCFDKNCPVYETKFTLEGNKLKLENELVNLEFDTINNTNDDLYFDSINRACYEFASKWNKESLGKFDWNRYHNLGKRK